MISSRLKGKGVLISEVGNPIGAEHAILMAMHGANVLACSHNIDSARSIAQEINTAGGNAIACYLNHTNQDSWTQAIANGISNFGVLSGLIHTPGVEESHPNLNSHAPFQSAASHGIKIGTGIAIPSLINEKNANVIWISSNKKSKQSDNLTNYLIHLSDIGLRVTRIQLEYSAPNIEDCAYICVFLCSDEAQGLANNTLTIENVRRRHSSNCGDFGRTGSEKSNMQYR